MANHSRPLLIKFLKIDVEGNDTNVIKGFQKYLDRTEYIIFECSDCLDDFRGPGIERPMKDIVDYLLDETAEGEISECGDVVEEDGQELEEAEEEGDEVDEEGDVEEEEKTDEELVDDFLNLSISKSNSEDDELSLTDIYQKFSEYCESNNYDCIDTSSFKKFLKSKYGKPEGKGDNAKYKYLNYI